MTKENMDTLTPEQLINHLQKENVRLAEELEQAQKDIVVFEKLAVEWRKGYADLKRKHNEETANLKQTIEELEKELENFKNE